MVKYDENEMSHFKVIVIYPQWNSYARILFEQHLVPATASLSLWLFRKSVARFFQQEGGGRREFHGNVLKIPFHLK